MADRRPQGAWLRAWTLGGHVLEPVAPALLRRRLSRGKELPDRWREKLGAPGLPRPGGRLVWLHAVGLGEVLALRGLIAEMDRARGDLSYLITSTARSSAEVAGRNLPPRTVHQFLPLDLPGPRRRFLDHWRPDLSVWAEQDLWPGLVADTAARGIPLALVNARMNDDAYRRRARVRGLYAPLLRAFGLIAAQDAATARNLEALSEPGPVDVTGSLKPAAPPLADAPEARAALESALGDRPLWLAASTHAADEAVVLSAHRMILDKEPQALLIVAPRAADRGPALLAACTDAGLETRLRSRGEQPDAETQVYIADTFGELGTWYRMAGIALVGGTFGAVEGHNPWEPARLDTAILHGPRTANFRDDFASLDAVGAALPVADAKGVADAVLGADRTALVDRARALADDRAAPVRALAARLSAMVPAS